MKAAIIISAGKSETKDEFFPDRQIGRISAIERIALLFKEVGIQRIVVIGDEKELPQKLLPHMNLVFFTISHEEYILDGIRQGLKYLLDKCTEVFISRVDVPMFSGETVHTLLNSKGNVCIPSFKGRTGYPILIRQDVFNDILSFKREAELADIFDALDIEKRIINVEDEGILKDIQSNSELEDLIPKHDISKLRASFRVRISKEKIFYGSGIHHLLKLVEEFGSVANACQHMGISYSKGRKIISVMEEEMGCSVLVTKQGGKAGGFSVLTKEAKEMMERYDMFSLESEQELQRIFKKYFSEY